MAEPTALIASATKIVAPAIGASRFALRKIRMFGTFDMRWLQLGAESPALTAAEVGDIEDFLGQRETRALLSALALTLLTPESDLRTASIRTTEDFFFNLVQQRHAAKPNKWHGQREALWSTILGIYDSATPAGQELAEAAVEYENFLRSPLGRAQKPQSESESDHGRWVERLSELCADIERVARGHDAARQLKAKIAAAPTPPIITYTTHSSPATFADLYVPRTLVDEESGANVESSVLGANGAPYRFVVRGAPGAGKSTFVQNLRRELSDDPQGQPAIVVTVKSYFPASQHQSLAEYLTSTSNATYNLDLTEQSMRDALTLGQAVVIFDGIDEIVDINQRVEAVQRIATFSTDYPAASILVTSRSVGYERAPLPGSVFRLLTLHEYSTVQTNSYVDNWFTFMSRPELSEDFFRESEAVADLKANPLLLSLLCILYRERGSIPRRRRDIYAQCADLLFHTWDSHRHVAQPEELHANGDRIMQELARWVFKSQAAQTGLAESVIRKTIGIYLTDAVGVDPGEARRRAGEFLDFCAGRAWLLGVTGNDYGERVFGFTHRTFFEYFAAEAIVRASTDTEDIANTLVQAHLQDETSVLPELMLQAVDEKIDRGAATTFKRACELTTDDMLILRLMEGVPLASPARAKGFERILQIWESQRFIRRESFVMLLTLNGDARTHFQRDFLAENAKQSAAIFLGAWATLSLQDSVERFAPAWQDTVDSLLPYSSDCRGWWFADAVSVWMWKEGHAALPAGKNVAFTATGSSGHCAGVLWLGLEVAAAASETGVPGELLDFFEEITKRARSRDGLLSVELAVRFRTRTLQRVARHGLPNGQALQGVALEAFLYSLGVMHEVSWGVSEMDEEFVEQLLEPAREFWQSREGQPYQRPPAPLAPQLAQLPRWLREWALEKRSFTKLRWAPDDE